MIIKNFYKRHSDGVKLEVKNMPVYNFYTTNPETNEISPNPAMLMSMGPRVEVEISQTKKTEKEEKTSASKSIIGYAILDTGSNVTCVDHDTMEKLGINDCGDGETMTPAGLYKSKLYPAHIKILGTEIEHSFVKALGANLSEQIMEDGKPIVALIGRDILSLGILIYDGQAGTYTLAH